MLKDSFVLVESVLSCVAALRVFFQTRGDAALEILALRQQLAVLKRKRPRPQLSRLDRIFWVALRRCWSRWTEVLHIVKPETVVRWHRAGFRLYWRWRSRPGEGGPKIAEEVRVLIRRLANDNPGWGAPKIHGELQKLGFVVSERTVARYLRRIRRRSDPGNVGWRFCRITEKRLSPSISSLFRRSSFNCCTASSSSSTPVVRSCTSMSRSARRRIGLSNNYGPHFRKPAPIAM